MSLLEVKIKIPVEQTIAVYQKLAPKIKEMKALGMSYREIATSLGIDKKTVGKALDFQIMAENNPLEPLSPAKKAID